MLFPGLNSNTCLCHVVLCLRLPSSSFPKWHHVSSCFSLSLAPVVSFPWDILASFPAWQTFYRCSGEPEALAAHLGRFTFPLTPAVAHVYVLQYVAEIFATMLVSPWSGWRTNFLQYEQKELLFPSRKFRSWEHNRILWEQTVSLEDSRCMNWVMEAKVHERRKENNMSTISIIWADSRRKKIYGESSENRV